LVPETQGRILADLYEEMLKVNRRPAGRGREGSAKDRFFARENS
jgi:hypothetical protein